MLKVRQREYELVVPKEKANQSGDVQVIQTKIIWTCVGLAGIDKNGVGFLAHFDTPNSTKVIPEIFAALKCRDVDFETLKLRMVTGLAGYFNPACLPTRFCIKKRISEEQVLINLPKIEVGTKRFFDTCGLIVDANAKTIKDDKIVPSREREMSDYEPDNMNDFNTYRTSSKIKDPSPDKK